MQNPLQKPKERSEKNNSPYTCQKHMRSLHKYMIQIMMRIKKKFSMWQEINPHEEKQSQENWLNFSRQFSFVLSHMCLCACMLVCSSPVKLLKRMQ
jgi:hypothetical protein